MILKINSTRGHTGSLLVTTTTRGKDLWEGGGLHKMLFNI